jgi:hypothetical protein
MLIRGPLGGGAASGALGAMVASHNKGGQYLRARTTPTNPNSSFQQTVRQALGALANRWENVVDSSQRATWNAYAAAVAMVNRLGDTIHISGFSQFIRSNVSRLQAGMSIVDDAPLVNNLGETPVIDSVVADESSSNVTVTCGAVSNAWLPDAARNWLLYVSPPQNAGKSFFDGPYRFAGTTSCTTSAITFSNPFPATAAGQQTFISLRVSDDDGRLSSEAKGSAIVQA